MQLPAALADAVAKRYAPKLRTDEEGWDMDCGLCVSHDTALECSFCNHVYHNTPVCIGEGNIASVESIADGAHWACPECWKETSAGARRKLLGGQLQPRLKRKRKRKGKQRVEDRGE